MASASLRSRTTIEEEIFHPAFLNATEEVDIHHRAVIEHYCAKKLIAEIEDSHPSDGYFDAKAKVLAGERSEHAA